MAEFGMRIDLLLNWFPILDGLHFQLCSSYLLSSFYSAWSWISLYSGLVVHKCFVIVCRLRAETDARRSYDL